MKKSKFNLSYLNSTTGNAGYLIPFLLQPTLPNDTFRLSLTSFIRAQPMLAPLMHEVKFYTQYWFVPNRLLWNDWEEFITGGEDLNSAPAFPTLPAGTTFATGSLGDYFGFPTGIDVGGISALPFRAYNEIWNTRYRDEDLQDELPISYGSGVDNTTARDLLSPSWKRDYFTTARPFTQRGNEVSVPISGGIVNISPTEGRSYKLAPFIVNINADPSDPNSPTNNALVTNIQLDASQAGLLLDNLKNFSFSSPWISETLSVGDNILIPFFNSTTPNLSVWFKVVEDVTGTFEFNSLEYSKTIIQNEYPLPNPWGSLDNSAYSFGPTESNAGQQGFLCGFNNAVGSYGGTTFSYGGSRISGFVNVPKTLSQNAKLNIRDLRASSALQRYAERSLQYGNRYEEFIQRQFGIKPRDSRIQRPEYLGGGSGMLQISEVLQTAEGTNTGVGTMRGQGVAGIGQRPIKFRSPEHGLIIGLLSIRPKPIYTQGVNREFLKKSRLDFFTPELANIGMQEVLQRELYFTPDNENTIFGYSDRYQEYRYNMPKVTGEFKSTLDFWNMARQFDAPPVLNSSFIDMKSSENAFYRPFASQSTHQYLMMLRNNIKAYRPIPKKAKNILR